MTYYDDSGYDLLSDPFRRYNFPTSVGVMADAWCDGVLPFRKLAAPTLTNAHT